MLRALLSRRRKILEVDRDGMQVLVAQVAGRLLDHLLHRAHRPRAIVGTVLEILHDVVDRPCREAFAFARQEAARVPPFAHPALEAFLRLDGAEEVLRRMACAAVAGAFD